MRAVNRHLSAWPRPCSVTHSHKCVRLLTLQIQFQYIVVDEGHRLKNFDCRLLKELRTIRANNRLLLSGV